MNLTPHFTLDELTRSSTAQRLGLPNFASPAIVDALAVTAQMLENVREHLSGVRGSTVPIVVTSAYRSPEVNRAVGGVTSSDHVRGMAADILVPAFGTPYEVAVELLPFLDRLGVGQMILEGIKGKRWLHLSTATPARPVNRVLTISDAGPALGLQRLA